MRQATCGLPGCTQTYEPTTTWQIYCSERCRNRASYEAAKAAGRTPPRREPFATTCTTCGEQFMSRRKGRIYCSKRCNDLGQPPCEHDGCDKPRRAKGLCIGHYNAQHPSEKRHPKQERICEGCGRRYATERPNGRCCSESCWATVVRRETGRSALAIPGQRRWHDIVAIPQQRKPFGLYTCGQCRICGTWFTSQYTQVTCSTECAAAKKRRAKRIEKLARRAKERGATIAKVDPWKIYIRDGWRCWICCRPVDQGLGPEHRMGPSLDHIVPLSWDDPLHDPSNLRLAHRICNSRRGNRDTHAQPMLFG